MINSKKHYVPILKWKRGERTALQLLNKNLKSHLMPVIEIVPIPWNYVEDCPDKTIDEHLQGIGNQLSEAWSIDSPIFVDLQLLDPEDRLKDGKHPLRYIREESRRVGVKVIPVTGSNQEPDYQSEVKQANKEDRLGVCLRLIDDDFDDLENRLEHLLNLLEVSPQDAYLLIDLQYIPPDNEKKTYISARSILKSIPQTGSWAAIILAGSSFPEHLSDIEPYSAEEIPRAEWLIWKEIAKKSDNIPVFSDYTINNPKLIDIDPRLMKMTANIRYTLDESWLVLKGGQIKQHRWQQIFEMCEKLTKDPRFYGANYSWGDNYIYNCAQRTPGFGPGNAEIWRRVGTNHHLTLVVNQIATFFAT